MLKLLLILDAKENVSLVALICKLDILDLAMTEMNKILSRLLGISTLQPSCKFSKENIKMHMSLPRKVLTGSEH